MGDARKTGAELNERAIDWLVALDCGTADEQAFDAWRAADPRHAAAFAQVAATWRRTADPRLGPLLDQSVEDPREPEPVVQRTWSRRAAVGGVFAAVLGLGAGGTMLAWPARAHAETAVGERRSIRLPDGSHAMLNTDTRIAWRFGDERTVWVERGEVALLVGPSRQPFRVHSDPIDGRLSTGSYSLRIEPTGGRLLVLSGQATIGAETVRAGNGLFINNGGTEIATLSPDAITSATAWQAGKIVFDGMPLGRAITEFNRYLPDKIVLQQPDLATTRLGGEFRTDDPANFLIALRDGFDIDNRRQGDRILLFRKHD
ncbi:DUF4880 domain-containing protein [Sphingomonas sp. H39-1-10]|uniref:FecR family protein n=1 Tax=Sphingomonas TaxID=13687 RepID=UPI000887F4EA|nr:MULTISPECIES: FecR domain-containing protein [Sphingomonas]MDF0488078.1 DUF4880 domain-containing protein [Sphingomonas pollutisoli]SDA33313.1 FecR family protein [Sphingomonas sp. NFR15]